MTTQLSAAGEHVSRPVDRSPASGDAAGHFRPDVQGLRAVAVVLVIAYHAAGGVVPGGYVGVDVFFVISGFLITGLLLRETQHTGRISLSRFYARRARRIVPVASLVLILIVLLSNHLLGYVRGMSVATDARWAALFAANFRFANQETDYLTSRAAPSPIQHYWSLAVEEQFYIVWPLLILGAVLLARRAHRQGLLLAILSGVFGVSLVWSIVETAASPTAAYFSPFTRAWELAAGGVLAVLAPRLSAWRRSTEALATVVALLGLACIAFATLRYGSGTEFPGYAALLPVAGAWLLLFAGSLPTARGIRRTLGILPLRWLGDLSFSLYLWHWPILIIAEEHAGHPLSGLATLACLGATLAVSIASYYAVERPIRSSSGLRKATWRALAVGVVSVAVVLLSAGVADSVATVNTRSDVPARHVTAAATIQDVLNAVAEAPAGNSVPAGLTPSLGTLAADKYNAGAKCTVPYTGVTSGACVFGDLSAARTVVLFGDSHAGMWLPAFDLIGKRAHWKVISFAKADCPLPRIPFWIQTLGRQFPECATWKSYVERRIRQIRPDLAVFTDAFFDVPDAHHQPITPAQWSAGYSATLAAVTPYARRSVVLGDIPYLDQPAPDCLAAHTTSVSACVTPASRAVLASHQHAEQQAAARSGVRYVDVTSLFCATSCSPIIDGIGVYADRFHISATWAGYLNVVIGKLFGMS